MDLNDIEVLVLSGGKGTRLANLELDQPKPMAPIKDSPFLKYLVDHLSSFGLFNFRFLTGYRAHYIIDYFKAYPSINTAFSHEDTPLGTGGALKKAILSSEKEFFLLVNGDTFFTADPTILIEISSYEILSMGLAYIKNRDRYGTVTLNKDYDVISLCDKEGLSGYINSGVYFLKRDIVSLIPDGFISLEKDIFPKLLDKGKIKAYPMTGNFIDIGIPSDFDRGQDLIPQWSKAESLPCLFLDRDGVIIEDVCYNVDPSRVKFLPNIIDLILKAKKNKWLVKIITNQAGVAKGYFTEKELESFHQHLIDALNKGGANLELQDIYYCPFHPKEGLNEYLVDSILRKPNPGMILQATSDHCIDLKKSLMVGDKISDIINLPSLKTVLIKGQYDLSSCPKSVDVVLGLKDVLKWIN